MAHRQRWLIGTAVVLALAVALALIAAGGGASLAAGDIIYVDADATGSDNGEDWTNAYTDLQDALGSADSGQQIWVAAGTYKPTEGADRTISFQMVNGVAIYGGFAGGETELGQRDCEANPTILSGDIGTEGDATDNSYHVFYHPGGLASTAVLDGFTITGGNANGADPHNRGGGMYNRDSSPTLTNVTFSYNFTALEGGGMYNDGSSPTLTNVTFSFNSAYHGSGMYNHDSSPTLTNCSFTGNSMGGGMYNHGSSPALTNVTFYYNFAAGDGGGMYNHDFSAPTLTNCTFSGNSAFWFVGGGGICNDGYSSPTLTNCILWGDFPGEVLNDGSSAPVVTYSDIMGGYPGETNINADPLFVNAGSGDLHLQPGSPCIDTGNSSAPELPGFDFEGDPRILDGNSDGDPLVDMGVDEVWGPPPPVIFVDREAPGTNSGTSWADAFTDLQHGLTWAADGGDEIWVAEGTYKPTWQVDSDPRSATFQMANGVAIYGGFDPSVGDTEWEERDWMANATILSGDIGGEGNPDDNSYHVFYNTGGLDHTAVLDGFTITGGNADGEEWPRWDGGGMYNNSSSPRLANLIFSENLGDHGAGLYNQDSSPALTNCFFTGNSATVDGGGMFNNSSSPGLANCTFAGNSATTEGGGIYNKNGSSPWVINCILWWDSPDEISGDTGTVTYSDVQGGDTEGGNISADPLFVQAAAGNVHLRPHSPCIDAGTDFFGPDVRLSLPEYDFEGDPRVMDGDGDGEPIVDMGVDEALWHPVHLPLVLRNY